MRSWPAPHDRHHPRLRPRATTTRSRSCSRSRAPRSNLLGVTTVSGNQTLEKTTANAIRVLDHVGRDDVPVAAGASRPLVRERHVAADVHGETGLDGPELPPPSRDPDARHAIDWIAATVDASTAARDAGADGAADEHRAVPGAIPGPGSEDRADRADGRRDRRGQHDARRRVQHLGRPRGGAPGVHERPRRDDGRARRDAQGADDAGARGAARRSRRAGKLVADLYALLLAVPREPLRLGRRTGARRGGAGARHRPDAADDRATAASSSTRLRSSRAGAPTSTSAATAGSPTAHVAVEIDADRFLALLVERISSLG